MESTGPVAAVLRFHHADDRASGGRIVLYDNRTVRFEPSERLIAELGRLAGHADETALKWGASLVVALAAIGATCMFRGKRTAGFGLFLASGMSGVGAAALRRFAGALVPMVLATQPINNVELASDAETGAVRFALTGSGMGRDFVVHLLPDDYDAAEGAVFLREFATLKGE